MLTETASLTPKRCMPEIILQIHRVKTRYPVIRMDNVVLIFTRVQNTNTELVSLTLGLDSKTAVITLATV